MCHEIAQIEVLCAQIIIPHADRPKFYLGGALIKVMHAVTPWMVSPQKGLPRPSVAEYLVPSNQISQPYLVPLLRTVPPLAWCSARLLIESDEWTRKDEAVQSALGWVFKAS